MSKNMSMTFPLHMFSRWWCRGNRVRFSHICPTPSKPRARTVGLACGVQLSLKVNWFINSFRGRGLVLELSTISWRFSSSLLEMVSASTAGLTTHTVLRPFHHLFSLHAQRCQLSPDGPCSPVSPGQPLLPPSLLLDPLSQPLFLLQHQQVLPGQHLVCHPPALASCHQVCESLGSGRTQPKGRGHPLAATQHVLVERVWLQDLASAEVAPALPAVPQTSTLVLANWCPAGHDCVPGDHGLTFQILRFRTGFSPWSSCILWGFSAFFSPGLTFYLWTLLKNYIYLN